jgi:hypothetical protein
MRTPCTHMGSYIGQILLINLVICNDVKQFGFSSNFWPDDDGDDGDDDCGCLTLAN